MPNQGFNQHGDILNKTKDGRDLNALWLDYQAVLADYNGQRQSLVNFLTVNVAEPIVSVPIIGQGGDFEKASEYGVPKGTRPNVSYYDMGMPFDWYDLAARFTWQFLADATQQQVDAVQNSSIEADSRLVFNKVMKRVFDNTGSDVLITGNPYKVYGFWNADGIVPQPYRTSTFAGTHSHYTTTFGGTGKYAGNALTAADFDDLILNVTEHGYTKVLGYRLIVMVNKTEAQVVRSFRSAASNNPAGTYDATHGDWDFIPSTGTNSSLMPRDVVLLGNQPDPILNGLTVIGAYGDALIIQDDYVPAGYLFCFATGGPANLQNPIGFRQHANPALQGMRLVKGPQADYPLIDSYYVRGFGVGVRERGAGAVLQVNTVSTTYVPPTQYA